MYGPPLSVSLLDILCLIDLHSIFSCSWWCGSLFGFNLPHHRMRYRCRFPWHSLVCSASKPSGGNFDPGWIDACIDVRDLRNSFCFIERVYQPTGVYILTWGHHWNQSSQSRKSFQVLWGPVFFFQSALLNHIPCRLQRRSRLICAHREIKKSQRRQVEQQLDIVEKSMTTQATCKHWGLCL